MSLAPLHPWRVLFCLALLMLLAAVLAHGRWWQLPDHHNPWAPLHIDTPPNWLTRHKLARLDDRPQTCLDVLAGARWTWQPLPDRQTQPGCGFSNAVRISALQVQIGPPVSLSCPAAVSLALWEQHVLLPAAANWLGSTVQRLEHYGSYACRNVAGRDDGRRSRHATADALDLAGVVLRDGRRISVARDWHRAAPTGPPAATSPADVTGPAARAQGPALPALAPEALFLRALHKGACRHFDGVLGPDYNAAHADHLHLERGGWRSCR